jgi:hypothetical protein
MAYNERSGIPNISSLVEVPTEDRKSVIKEAKDRKSKPAITQLTNEEIIGSLKKCRGLYYLVAHHLGVSKGALSYRIANDPELEAVAKDERGRMLDVAETKLMEAVEEGQQWAIQMILKTLGRDRGYVERQEIASVSQVRLQVVEEIVDANSSPDVTISVNIPSGAYKPKLPESFDDASET